MATTPEWPPTDLLTRSPYPELDHEVEYIGPNVLVSDYSDGSQSVRVKSTVLWKRYTERWRVSRTDAYILLRFFEEFQLHRSFTKRALEPSANTNDFQNLMVLCRFEQPPRIVQLGNDWYELEFTLRQSDL